MKKTLVLLMMAAIMALSMFGCQAGSSVEAAANEYFAEFPGNRIVTWEDLFAKIDAGDEPFILSIRQADVYEAGHIKGAYLAAWGTDLAEKTAMLPTDEPVYVYCYTGQTAGQAVALLNMLGIEAYSVKSGFNSGAMKVEGYEAYVDTAANELPDAKAKLDKKVLEFVQEYFNTVGDNANNIVAAADAVTLLDAGDAVVVDIRSAEDYAAGHIEGAVNVAFGAGMQEKFADLPKDKKLIVACYSGQTSGQTVAVMRALGFDALSLKSGMNLGWTPFVKTNAANAYFADYPGNRIVEWADVFAKIDAGENPFILSIRQADVYGEGHIKGAYLAAWGEDLAAKVAMLPTDQPVYVYCYTGQTAGQAVALMNMLGIEAYSIKSGFNSGAMKTEGYEAYVETTANELSDAAAAFEPFLLKAVQDYFNAVADNANFIISIEDAKAAVEAGEVTVVDIRTAEDFSAGHVEGAINIPFGGNMQEGFAELPSGKLVVTCYSGQTAGQATAVLRMLGYDAVSMKLGMKLGWVASEYPVVTD